MTTFCFSYSGDNKMPLDNEPNSMVGWIAAWLGGLGAATIALRKMFVSWKTDDTMIAHSSAHTSLIEQLHSELVRMSEQNTLLAAEVHRLQIVVIELTEQVGMSNAEKQGLRSEIASLNSQIAELRNSPAGNQGSASA